MPTLDKTKPWCGWRWPKGIVEFSAYPSEELSPALEHSYDLLEDPVDLRVWYPLRMAVYFQGVYEINFDLWEGKIDGLRLEKPEF